MSLNLVKTVVDILQSRPEEKFTTLQIAGLIFKLYPEKCYEKKERSSVIKSDTELIRQIAAEISSKRLSIQKQSIKVTEGYPRKYYYTNKTDTEEVATAESYNSLPDNTAQPKERDLYYKLSEFLWTEFNIYSKRINEKRSSNNRGPKGNKWLYPDIVAMEDLSNSWCREVKDCVQQYAEKKTRLWSFEVKVLLNRSNVREAFFQAVSNSTWANHGYLVATEIGGVDTLKELRILATLHGIGFIRLSTDNPAESEILIPSRMRDKVDWDTVNRLAEENSDFLEYIKLIRRFYQTGDQRARDWDIFLD